MNSTTKIIGAALAGAAVGAATALLFAPAAGADTRKKLMSKVKSAKEGLDGYLANGEDTLNNAVNKAKQTAKEV